ncbi:DUF7108 family protein [Haloarcula amylovorans]|uniref:DUF7108 family protein n=1 Tax=Haloarcula amylovorans TaxID=2562280 RepID=UPI001075E1ED|nr:rnhA operon protein [Halomicroarcula amylolytica]
MTDLPDDTTDEVERLTKLAREAVDEKAAAAYREDRDALLDEHDYTARIREEDTGEVLVCHPAEWVDDGVIRPERVEDTDRGVEIRLSGPEDPDEWDEVETANRTVVEEVQDEHGDVHGATADALADFMGNHYSKAIADATPEELAEFREEYFPRNAWPTDEQQSLLDESVRLTVEKAGGRIPER